jgi:hypothetical protein
VVAYIIWVLIVGRDLPGLLVSAADHLCAFLQVTAEREILSAAIPDAEEAFTSIFESPLRTR